MIEKGKAYFPTISGSFVIPKIKIYPNPAKDYLKIELPQSTFEVKISNSSGQDVFHQKLIKDEIIINTLNFTNGIYFLTINTLDKRIMKSKLIILSN